MSKQELRRVCVFCGSRPGAHEHYLEPARALGAALAATGRGLVYGGARVGLMGVVADAALAAGGEVIGVLPRALMTKELAHPGLHALHVVDSMHARKALMAELCDGFIAMPGGFGTYEELFEVITWAQLGIHEKPIGVLDVAGYFGPFRALVEGGVASGFIRPEYRGLIVVETQPGALLDVMAAHEMPRVRRWVTPRES